MPVHLQPMSGSLATDISELGGLLFLIMKWSEEEWRKGVAVDKIHQHMIYLFKPKKFITLIGTSALL